MNQTTINQRIRDILKHYDFSDKQLGDLIGVSKQAIGQYAKNETIPADKILIRIIIALKDLNARWLITGEGEMLDGERIMPSEADLTEFGGILLERLLDEKEKVGALTKEIEYLKAEIDNLRGGGHRQEPVEPKARAG